MAQSSIRLNKSAASASHELSCWPARWNAAAQAYAVLTALGIGYFIFGIPIQTSDCIGNLLNVQDAGLFELVVGAFSASGYLRPLLWANLKVIFDLSGGHYFLAYKAFHVLQVTTVLMLFVRLLRVASFREFLIAAFSINVLLGLHTFSGTVREGFPVNHFLSEILYLLAVINLATSNARWWKDLAAALIFFVALFTIESGAIVWVAMISAYLLGFRGLSKRALTGSTIILVSYLLLRFLVLDVGAPDLSERSSGYGFRVLSPPELIDRFGHDPLPFYAYNVTTSMLSVLFSEPRQGIWKFLEASRDGAVPAWMRVNLLSSIMACVLFMGFVRRRCSQWIKLRFQRDDRLFLLFPVVLVANAVISYPYTKDVIMSMAGVMYALAAYVTVKETLESYHPKRAGRFSVIIAISVLTVAGLTWSIRTGALYASLREQAYNVQTEWALAWDELASLKSIYPTPQAALLIDSLRDEALAAPIPNPHFARTPLDRLLDPY